MKISSFRFTQMNYTEPLNRIFKFEKSNHAIAMAGSKRHAELLICRRRHRQPTSPSSHCHRSTLASYPPDSCRRIDLVDISIRSTPTLHCIGDILRALPPPTSYPTEIHRHRRIVFVIAIVGISFNLHLNLKTIVASKLQSCLQQVVSRRMHRSSQEDHTESLPTQSVK